MLYKNVLNYSLKWKTRLDCSHFENKPAAQRESTTYYDKTATTHFLVPFCQMVKNFFSEFLLTFFLTLGNFWTPQPPFWWKILYIIQNSFS